MGVNQRELVKICAEFPVFPQLCVSFLCSKQVILPIVQSRIFSEDLLKHPAVEYCSPSEAAPGESTPCSLLIHF